MRWLDKDGTKEEARCDLIVGADGAAVLRPLTGA